MQILSKNQNTNWKYLLIVVVLAFLVGGGILIYQYWWLPKTEIPVSTLIFDKTANWKTYRNEDHVFEIKYPPDFSLFESASTEVQFSKSNDLDYPDIIVTLTETDLTPTEWINNYLCKPLPSGSTLCTTLKSGPISESIQVQSQGTHFNSADTIFKHNDILFDISLSEKRAAPIPQDEFDVYNQILSTFRFLE